VWCVARSGPLVPRPVPTASGDLEMAGNGDGKLLVEEVSPLSDDPWREDNSDEVGHAPTVGCQLIELDLDAFSPSDPTLYRDGDVSAEIWLPG
jgi:hypothetical protein